MSRPRKLVYILQLLALQFLQSTLGAFMATTGIRYFKGDLELTRWVIKPYGTSAECLALPFTLLGLALIIGRPILLARGDPLGEADPKLALRMSLLAIAVLAIVVVALDLEAFKLFWSDVGCRIYDGVILASCGR